MSNKYLMIEAWVEGTRPVLVNRATEDDLMGKTRQNTPGAEEEPRDIAERHVYRFKHNNQLCFPGEGFARMMREAGGSHKAKGQRKSLKYIVPAAVVVMDDLCGFFLKDRKTPITEFEVDSRPVTIPATKGRVMRHRAKIMEWTCRVTLRINTVLLDEQMVRRLLSEGIETIGLGDKRPSMGIGDVVLWQVLNRSDKLSPSQIHAVG